MRKETTLSRKWIAARLRLSHESHPIEYAFGAGCNQIWKVNAVALSKLSGKSRPTLQIARNLKGVPVTGKRGRLGAKLAIDPTNGQERVRSQPRQQLLWDFFVGFVGKTKCLNILSGVA